MSAEGNSSVEESLDAQARRHLPYIGKGSLGLLELKKKVGQHKDAPWLCRIPLEPAIMSDNMPCLRYLLDTVKVETVNTKNLDRSPLDLCIIWGKLDMMVYLLSRGADPMLDTDQSALNRAQLRQQRLQEAHEKAGDGVEIEQFAISKSQIKPMIEGGVAMLEILEGVAAHGSYEAWAYENCHHILVKRFSPSFRPSVPRSQLAFLRALVLAGRATLRPADERAAIAAREAAHHEFLIRENQPLISVLMTAGFSKGAAKEIRDAFRFPNLKAVRAAKLSPEDIEKQLEPYLRQKRISEADGRRFSRYVRELEEPVVDQAKADSSKSGGYPTKEAAKSAAKSKAKAAPAAKAALLALAAKNTSAKAAPKASASKKKRGIDGMEVLFNEDLPDNAFVIVACFLFSL